MPDTSAPSAEFYTSDEYARRHPDWHRSDSPWKAAQVLTMLRRHGLVPRTVTEVGCGAGGILAALQKELPAETRFTGYEIAPTALELAKPIANERLSFVQGDFIALAPPPVDLLLTMDVAEHVEDYIAFMRALRPRAKHHIYHLPLDLSVLSMMQPQRLRWNFESVGHLHYFTAETARRAIENASYEIQDSMLVAMELDRPAAAERQQRMRFVRKMCRAISPTWTARVLGGFSLLVLCR